MLEGVVDELRVRVGEQPLQVRRLVAAVVEAGAVRQHQVEQDEIGIERGRELERLWPGALQLLQFVQTGRARTAVPTTIHCDHLVQARTAAESDLRRRDLRLPTRARVRSGKAQAGSLGHFIDLCTGATVDGFCTRLESGYGVANFAPVPAWIGYVPIRGLFVNNISSVRSVGQNSILFNNPDFDPSGGTVVIPPNVVRTLSDFGFDNVTESGFMFF